MRTTLDFGMVLGFAIAVVGWFIAARSQLQMGQKIKPWARNFAGGIRLDTLVMFRPELLFPEGLKHRRRLFFGLSLFLTGMLLAGLCGFFK